MLPRHKLAEKHTTDDLVKMMREIEAKPENQMPPGSIWRFVPKARKKLDEIAHAIAIKAAEKRVAAGNPVQVSGYSGRQTKRRK